MIYLSDDLLKAKKANVLATFKAFVNYCNSHNLKYYGAYGTVLGAARHHGFIPWDDDVDVYMPRADYEKFIELMTSQPPTGYDLFEIRSMPNYFATFAKFCDANTTILESKELRICIGNFVDVFPLDKLPDNKEERESYCKKMGTLRYLWIDISFHRSRRHFLEDLKGLHLKLFIRQFICTIFRSIIRTALKKAMRKNDGKYERINSNYQGFAGSDCKNEHNMRSDVFGEGAYLPFEDFEIRVPSQYEVYLKNIYGNWRQFPPKEKQKPQHYIEYLNLKKRVAYDEVKKLI